MTNDIISALLAFFFTLSIQLLIWHFFRIKSEIFLLLGIYFLSILSILVFAVHFGLEILDFLIIFLLYSVLSVSYLQTYPALRENIPSFSILFLIKDAGSEGVTTQVLCKELEKNRLFQTKLDDLLKEGFVKVEIGERIKLTTSGKFLATFFNGYRRLLGLKIGEG